MSERASHTNWRQPITGHKSNSGGRKGWKQAEKPTLTEQGIDVDEFHPRKPRQHMAATHARAWTLKTRKDAR